MDVILAEKPDQARKLASPFVYIMWGIIAVNRYNHKII